MNPPSCQGFGRLGWSVYRGAVESIDGSPAPVLGPARRRGCGLEAGDRVRVELEPEGPQRRDLAPISRRARRITYGRRILERAGAVLPQGLSALDRPVKAQPGALGGADRRRRRAGRAGSERATLTVRALLEPWQLGAPSYSALATKDGAFMEPSGRNRRQPMANGAAAKAAQIGENRCRGLRPVAAGSPW